MARIVARITLKVELLVPDGVSVDQVINESDYTFTPGEGGSLVDSELEDYDITSEQPD